VEDRIDLLLVLYLLLRHPSEAEIVNVVDWQFKRHTKGSGKLSRIRVQLSIAPYRAVVSGDLASIRVTGKIVWASLEEGLKGRTVGIDLRVGEPFRLRCSERWLEVLKLRGPIRKTRLVLCVFDERHGVVATVNGSIAEVYSSTYSPGGKYYGEVEADLQAEVRRLVEKAVEEARRAGAACVVACPAVLRRQAERLKRDLGSFEIVEVEVGGLEGVLQVLRRDEVRRRFADNEVVSNILLSEAIARYADRGTLVYGVEEVAAAVSARTIRYLIMTRGFVVENLDAAVEWVVEMLRARRGVRVVDETTPLGVAVSRLGGAVGMI